MESQSTHMNEMKHMHTLTRVLVTVKEGTS
jgi:hypothetical protein